MLTQIPPRVGVPLSMVKAVVSNRAHLLVPALSVARKERSRRADSCLIEVRVPPAGKAGRGYLAFVVPVLLPGVVPGTAAGSPPGTPAAREIARSLNGAP